MTLCEQERKQKKQLKKTITKKTILEGNKNKSEVGLFFKTICNKKIK